MIDNSEAFLGWESDKPREKCGVFGVIGLEGELGKTATYIALVGLQHRGQDGAGIVTHGPHKGTGVTGFGTVIDVFKEGQSLEGIPNGEVVIGHNRYSTNSGGALQPIINDHFSIAHNGHIEKLSNVDDRTDTQELAEMIEGRINNGFELRDAIQETLQGIEGAYSLIIAAEGILIGIRDPHGMRPLAMGRGKNGEICFASEDSVLNSIEFRYERDVEPGEMVIVTKEGPESRSIIPEDEPDPSRATCAFEFVYFARPDSNIEGRNVHIARANMGKILFENEDEGFEADIVIGVPDSGVPAAIGYGKASPIEYEAGLTKNRYITRTFIKANQDDRKKAVRLKQHVNPEITRGQRIVLIDDSIVRGTTTKELVRMLKHENGGQAAEVHLRIASPPYKWPCYFGMDTGDPAELIANNMTHKEIVEYLGVDSLSYLSVEDVSRSIGIGLGKLCFACANGQYPMKIE